MAGDLRMDDRWPGVMIWANVTHQYRSAANLAKHLPGDLILIGAVRGSIVPSVHAKVKL